MRYRYDELETFPEGLLVLGDAMGSLNPVHSTGRAVAAQQVLALRSTLRGGRKDLARRFFRAASAPIDQAWSRVIASDLAVDADASRRRRSLSGMARFRAERA